MTATRRTTDLADAILRGIYKRGAARILSHHHLAALSAVPALSGYPGAQTGLCCAATPGFVAPRPSPTSVVIGGGCLGYSQARTDRVRVDYLVDTVLTVTLAAWTGCRCVIYLPVGEELLVTDTASHDDWRRLGDVVQAFVDLIAGRVAPRHPVEIIRTDSPEVSSLLDDCLDRRRRELDGRDLTDLYTVRPSVADRDNAPGPQRLHQYRRTIITYLPETIRRLLNDRTIAHVVVAENLHQVRAVAMARQITASTAPADRIDYLAHLPTPSITATNRMARADERSAIHLLDPPDHTAVKIDRMVPVVRRFWEAFATVRTAFSDAASHGAYDVIGDGRRMLLAADADRSLHAEREATCA
ncbi:MAG TPA: hypothetical protein VNV66_13260 [Pilimelia sp.]|nr:hypothetical protein [Pilimelia sp.]